MTKKHYIALAEVVRAYYQAEIDGSEYILHIGIADVLEQYNPRFDRGKFIAYCLAGLEPK